MSAPITAQFWQLSGALSAPALLGAEPSNCLTYTALVAACAEYEAQLPRRGKDKQLGAIMCANDASSVIAYLSALRREDALALLPRGLSAEALQSWLARYQPDWLLLPNDVLPPAGKALLWRDKHCVHMPAPRRASTLHPDLALLLATSGSTGSPRMVRLSYANLAANAAAIAQYLALDASERAITSLPLHYSYGLSLLNSHLAAGAAVVLSDEPMTSRAFWELFRQHEVSSLAGVPYTWQMLQRLRLERMNLPSLRTLTQAGGRLAPELIEHFRQLAAARAWRFFVMYGQTEATARIAFVPPAQLAEKCGAIGYAIPGGELSLAPHGELLYRGPNVMMGYAECREDLAEPDTLHGMLATGDLARVDADGCYWLTGRIKRIAKVFGTRVSLDEIEAMLEAHFACLAVALDEDDALRIAITEASHAEAIRDYLRDKLGVHASGIRISCLAQLPLTPSGKVDYPTLRSQIATDEAQRA